VLAVPLANAGAINLYSRSRKKVTGKVFWEFAVLVENFVFVLRLFFLVSLLTALVYTIAPANSERDAFEQRIESGVFVFAAVVGLLILTIL
jgi:hypothetical protein